MNKTFDNIPRDENTRILMSVNLKFGDLDCVFQTWSFEKILGNSLIFYAADLEFESDEEIKNWILKNSEIVQNKSVKSMTVSRNPAEHPYVFVNFDFRNVS